MQLVRSIRGVFCQNSCLQPLDNETITADTKTHPHPHPHIKADKNTAAYESNYFSSQKFGIGESISWVVINLFANKKNQAGLEVEHSRGRTLAL